VNTDREEIRRFASDGLTQADAFDLAQRIKEQRELIRQVAQRQNAKHARCLMRLNMKLRRKFLAIAEKAGLNTKLLILK
jgi:hypothetical protein